MILLAIDTASTLCAACVYDSAADAELGRAVLDLGKGHAEHLIGVVDDAMRQAGVGLCRSRRDRRLGRAGLVHRRPRRRLGGARLCAGAEDPGGRRDDAGGDRGRGARAGPGRGTILAALDAGRGEVNLAVYDGDGALRLRSGGRPRCRRLPLVATEHMPVLAGSAASMVAEAARRRARDGRAGGHRRHRGLCQARRSQGLLATSRSRSICAMPTPSRRRASYCQDLHDRRYSHRFWTTDSDKTTRCAFPS